MRSIPTYRDDDGLWHALVPNGHTSGWAAAAPAINERRQTEDSQGGPWDFGLAAVPSDFSSETVTDVVEVAQ